jgi:curved DNA-binding protein CbpA
MEDAFSLFDLERRPLIDEAALKEKYLRLAAKRHPDLSDGDSEKFSLLQDAYKTLREPAARLRHLMELEFPDSDAPSDFTPDAQLFMSAGTAVQSAKAVFSRLENATTALARALLSPEIAAALRQVREAMKSVQHTMDQGKARLENFDARWPEVSATELAGLALSFTFLSRWLSQLSEWEFRLANE